MKKNKEKLYCELSNKEKIVMEFSENSMLFKFYNWLKTKHSFGGNKLKGGKI